MDTRTDFDVAIVGASIAGCATATLLARHGLSVALVDKHSGPDSYKRLCGHYIQASATPVIARLGIGPSVEANGGRRNGLDIWTRWGVIPHPGASESFGYSIRRSKLDPMIRRVAAETPGVEYMPGLEAVGLGRGSGMPTVELRDRKRRDRRVSARLVVGADGRSSKLAQLAKAPTKVAGNQRFCYMAYFNGVDFSESPRGLFWAMDPDVAIASPNDDDHTVMAVFLHKDRLESFGSDRATALHTLFANLPCAPGMADARLAGKVVGYKDYGLALRDPNPLPGVALVGDAALTCDPVMAIGCGVALQSAEWLADAVGPALAAGEPLDPALRGYKRTHRRRLGPHHAMLKADARATKMNPLQRLLFAAGTRDSRTASVLHGYAERTLGPQALLSPRTVARAAGVRAGLIKPPA